MPPPLPPSRPRVLFVAAGRQPPRLDETSAKRLAVLSDIFEPVTIAFAQDRVPRRVRSPRAYLLPYPGSSLVRHFVRMAGGFLLVLWCIVVHRTEVVVAQSPFEGAPAALAARVARLFRRRVALVVENHGDFETAVFMQRGVAAPRLTRRLIEAQAGFALSQAHAMRAVSDSTRRQLEDWVDGAHVHQFPTWTDFDVFLSMDGHREPNATILFAGILVPRKGVHFLIEAFHALGRDFPHARLVVAGHPENPDYARQIKTQAEGLGVGDRVTWRGRLSQADLAHAMREAAVFCLPTEMEGLPRVVFEAMAAGLPVVASNVSGIPEIVDHGKTGFLVSHGDVDGLTGHLRWVLENPDEARSMGLRARERARTVFSTTKYVEGYRTLIADALAAAGA